MRAPRQSGEYPDRHIDCQMALEDGLLELLSAAQAEGWSMSESLAAIIDVADNTSLALEENERLNVENHVRKFLGGD